MNIKKIYFFNDINPACLANIYSLPRVGVSADCPGGVAWTHVTSDVLFQAVSSLQQKETKRMRLDLDW